MSGALHAIATSTGWYPRRADHLVGTSAGSVLAALGAAGVPPWLLIPDASAAYSTAPSTPRATSNCSMTCGGASSAGSA